MPISASGWMNTESLTTLKIDRKIFKSEVEFCKDLADKLGFKKGVVAELSSKIYSDPVITSDREALMKSAFRYLK